MPPFLRICNPIRLKKLTKVMEIGGADTYVHWSVFAVTVFILAGVVAHPGLTILGLMCYYSVLLIHETGHLIAAQRKGCQVIAIELYPFFGVTRYTMPWSRLDHCIIAWGGVIAQAIVFIPLVGWVGTHGYTHFEGVNMIFAILGFFSLGVAIFNLLPIQPLDGAMAWRFFPELFSERKKRKPLKKPTYR